MHFWKSDRRFLRIAIIRAAALVAAAAVPGAALAQDSAPVVGTATRPRDLSPWGMFVNADSVVKAVLIGLAFASLVTWTVWLAKTIEIVICRRRVRAALNILASVRSTSEGVERLADAKGLELLLSPLIRVHEAIEKRGGQSFRFDGAADQQF